MHNAMLSLPNAKAKRSHMALSVIIRPTIPIILSSGHQQFIQKPMSNIADDVITNGR